MTPGQGGPGTELLATAEFGPFDAVSDVAHALYLKGFALRAVEACEQWARLTQAAGDHETTRYLRYIEATSLQELGRAAEALEVAERLLADLGDSPQPVWRAKALAVIAESSGRIHEHGRSIAALAEAHWRLDLIPAGSYGHLSASMAVALALRSANLLEQADAALLGIRSAFDPDVEVLVAQELALLSAFWGASLHLIGREADASAKFATASSRARRMVRVAHAVGNVPMVGRGEVIDASASMQLGDGELAALRARAAAEKFRPRPELVETHLLHLVLGRDAVDRHDTAAAREHLRAVVEDAEAARRDMWAATGRWALSGAYESEFGPHPAIPEVLAIARGALSRNWSERAGRFAALLDRHQLRELAAESARTGRAAMQDPLTQLGNRRLLESPGNDVQARSWAVFLDVDNFKAINDDLSHAIGDVVLRTVAQIIRSHARSEDLLIRYGGDEFLILPDGGSEAAASLAERVCSAVACHPWNEVSDALHVTVSVGVGPADHTATAPWAAADAALQQAKRGGRARVVMWQRS